MSPYEEWRTTLRAIAERGQALGLPRATWERPLDAIATVNAIESKEEQTRAS